MTAIQVSQCIMLLAAAFALICLGIVLIKALSTLDGVNKTLDETNKVINEANETIDDINYKLDLLNAPIEKFNYLFTSNKTSRVLKGVSLVGSYRSGMKRKRRKRAKKGLM